MPGHFPYHRRRVPLQADGRGPHAAVRRRGRPGADQPALQATLRRHDEAKRLSTAFDSRDALRRRPGRSGPTSTARSATSGVSICTLDDVKVLYGGLRPLRAQHVGLHDHQRPGAHHAGHVPQHGHRPAGREVHGRNRAASRRGPRARCASGPMCCPDVRGTVQADILKEDQGQNTCIFSIDFALKMMGDIQQYLHREQRAQLLLGLDLSGYHIAEAGANPITQLAFTLANGFTYVEYYLVPRHAHRQLRARTSPSSSPTAWTRSTRSSAGWRAASGPSPCRDKYGGRRRVPDAQVPHPDLRPVAAQPGDPVQRHPHHAPGALRRLRQLQQPAHQRLRRGDHHARPRSRCAGPWPSS